MPTSSFNSKFVIADKNALKNLEKAFKANDKHTSKRDIEKEFKETEKELKEKLGVGQNPLHVKSYMDELDEHGMPLSECEKMKREAQMAQQNENLKNKDGGSRPVDAVVSKPVKYLSLSKIWDYGLLLGIGFGLNSDGGKKYPCTLIITVGKHGLFIGPHY